MKTIVNRLLITLAMIPLLLSCSHNENLDLNGGNTGGIRVKVTRLVPSSPKNELKYSGSVEAATSTPLSFQTTGSVQNIYVHEGDPVHKGQLIAETDKTSFQSAYNAAKAQYEQAVDAKERLKKVYDKGSLPEVKWVEIKSKVAQAEAQMRIAGENLENCELRSPVDGILGHRAIEVGMPALQMQAPFSIISIDDVFIKIPVTEDEISKLRQGQTARIHIPAVGYQVFEGSVERIGVVANQLSRTYDVKIRTTNMDHAIKPGMVCNVEIEIPETKDLLLVPMEAVIGQTEGNPFVYVVDPEQKRAEKRPVELGGIVNNKLQVISGLSSNELIVTYGKHKLTNNAKVIY